jgi:hypothetical protein
MIMIWVMIVDLNMCSLVIVAPVSGSKDSNLHAHDIAVDDDLFGWSVGNCNNETFIGSPQ